MTDHTSQAPAPAGWFIVSQVKTHRVIYFTDDPGYRPPTEGDWFFVTHHLGELPAGMTLRDCWSWRFDGQAFRHAGDPPPADAPARLLENNRKALHALLRELVDELRKPWTPACAGGETLRAAKLAEAAAYRRGLETGTPPAQSPLLQGLAAARGLAMADAASLVLERHDATLEAMIESEALRERYRHAIDMALTDDDLSRLRRQLLDQLDARQLAALPPPPVALAAAEQHLALEAPVRDIEVARLQAQLRHAVNTQRRRIDAGYDHNDGLMKHKAKMAQTVLNNDGEAPDGQDVSLLANLAGSRNLSLADAARLVLGTVTEAESILRRTEREKDRFLARIDAARTLQEFQTVSLELRAFADRHARA